MLYILEGKTLLFFFVVLNIAEQEYHKNTMKGIRLALHRHLSDIGRDFDNIHDKTFKQAYGILQAKLKQNMQLALSKPTQPK